MRASLEADKKQTIENITKTLEKDKHRCIEETKKKQWVSNQFKINKRENNITYFLQNVINIIILLLIKFIVVNRTDKETHSINLNMLKLFK